MDPHGLNYLSQNFYDSNESVQDVLADNTPNTDSQTEDTNTGGAGTSNPTSSNKRERTSKVWNHFTMKEVEINGIIKMRAFCNYCGKNYVCGAGGGTGHLARHCAICVPKHSNPTDPRQSTLNLNESGLTSFKYDQMKQREGLAMYVASAEQPLGFGEHREFEYYVQNNLQPQWSKVCRNTTRSDMMNLYVFQKNELCKYFNNFTGTISFTSDMWTGCNHLGYLSLTGHYIDPDTYMLNKRILGFRMLEHPHSGNNIYNCILGILNEYNLQNRCFSITFDNASPNNACIEIFKKNFTPPYGGELFHIRCMCHVINLLVKSGLDEISNYISKIRSALLLIITSPSRLQEFRRMCKNYNLKPKKFAMDVQTRWNSTYYMLKSCVGYDKIITDFGSSHGIELEQIEWEYAFNFMKFLEIFENCTNQLSGVYYPTTCHALGCIYEISNALNECRDNDIYRNAISKMDAKFQKYWEKIHLVFFYSAIMDPRIKLDGAIGLVQGIAENMNYEMEFSPEMLKDKLFSLFNKYQDKYGSAPTVVTRQPTTSSKSAAWNLISKIGRGGSSRSSFTSSSSSSTSSRTELSRYLENDFIPNSDEENIDNFDILSWWKQHSRSYPVLSIMARDLLTPPASTVASESAFSAGGRVLTEQRSRLETDILEAQIWIKDWRDAYWRIQDQKEDFSQEFRNLEMD